MRTGGDENIHGKEANRFYLTVPKLDNLKNKHGEKSEIIIHLAKKKNYCRNKKRQLKLTNIKITQNNKSKIETTTTSKNEEPKKTKQNKIQFSKKEVNVIRQELTFPGCRGTSSKSFLSSGSVKVF